MRRIVGWLGLALIIAGWGEGGKIGGAGTEQVALLGLDDNAFSAIASVDDQGVMVGREILGPEVRRRVGAYWLSIDRPTQVPDYDGLTVGESVGALSPNRQLIAGTSFDSQESVGHKRGFVYI